MRKALTRLALVGATVAALLPVAPSAHAFVCNDNFPDPETGKVMCFVVYTVTAPVCNRFGCG